MFIADRDAFFVTDDIVGDKGEFVAVLDSYSLVFKSAYSVFRTLCVKKNGYGQTELFTNTLYRVDCLFVLFM